MVRLMASKIKLLRFYLVLWAVATAQAGMLTPLEASGYRSLPNSAQVAQFLEQFAARSPFAKVISYGRSAGGRPLVALLLSSDAEFLRTGQTAPGKLKVMLVGGQHGTEPSGAEALQVLAREVAVGSLQGMLIHLDLILVPNSNPDGRDLKRRVNSNGINLSTDYVLLSQPESLGLVQLLNRFQPHALLDVHESAVLKPKSLGAQGYLTDFEAQFEYANYVNIAPELKFFAEYVFLPELLAAVNAKGLAARRYIGEIVSIDQPITHGGISLRNLRNYAGMRGTLAYLVENRLDPPGDWPTPRNIQARVAKQRLCLLAFLEALTRFRQAVLDRVEQARQFRPDRRIVALRAEYAPLPSQPKIAIGLRRLDTREQVVREFEYRGRIAAQDWVVLPKAYAIVAQRAVIARLLDRHGIGYQQVTQAQAVVGYRLRVAEVKVRRWLHSVVARRKVSARLEEAIEKVTLTPGDLVLDLRQPGGALAFLLLDPRSSTSIFQEAMFSPLLVKGKRFFGIPLIVTSG